MTEAFTVKVQEFETKSDERFKKMEGDTEKKLQEQKASMNKVEEKMANLEKVVKEMHEANKRAPRLRPKTSTLPRTFRDRQVHRDLHRRHHRRQESGHRPVSS